MFGLYTYNEENISSGLILKYSDESKLQKIVEDISFLNSFDDKGIFDSFSEGRQYNRLKDVIECFDFRLANDRCLDNKQRLKSIKNHYKEQFDKIESEVNAKVEEKRIELYANISEKAKEIKEKYPGQKFYITQILETEEI